MTQHWDHRLLDSDHTLMSRPRVSGSSSAPTIAVKPTNAMVYHSPEKILHVAITTALATNGANPPIQPLPSCSATETPL